MFLDRHQNKIRANAKWYDRWHNHPHYNKVHWAVLILYILSIVTFSIPIQYPSQTVGADSVETKIPSSSGTWSSSGGVSGTLADVHDDNTSTGVVVAADGAITWDFGSTYASVLKIKIYYASGPTGTPVMSFCLYPYVSPGLKCAGEEANIVTSSSVGAFVIGWNTKSITANDRSKIKIDNATDATPADLTINEIEVYYLASDQPPAISISSPANNCNQSKHFTKESSITVSGTASDDVSVSSVTVNGSAASGTTSWSKSGVSLGAGDNTITAVATDSSSQTASASMTVNRDATAPSVTISSPSNGYSTSDSTVVVSGSSSDNSGGSGVSSVTSSTGSSVSGTTSWSTTVNLNNGSNTITITSTDCANNSSSSSITVTKTTSGGGGECNLSAPTVQDCGDVAWGTITIKSPNGGENYLVGSGTNATTQTNITWDYDQGTYKGDHIILQYTTNNGSTYQDINTNININSTSYTWTLPTNLKSQQIKVKAKVLDRNSALTNTQDTSDNNFEVHWNEAPGVTI